MSGSRRTRRTPDASAAVASSPWIVVSVGVVVMVVLLVVALGAYRGRAPAGLVLPEPEATMPLPTPSVRRAAAEPPAPVAPRLTPRATPSPSATRPAGRSPSPSAPGGPASVSAPPVESALVSPPPVTGTYRVVEEFNRSFVGEVLLRNASGTDQEWTVRLTVPDARLVASWVEGAPQGQVSRSGDTWTFTGGAGLAPGGTVPLRFQYDRTRANRPTSCTVGDAACAGLD
ncbi:cellulose binding domain-containing protein [Micromonospora olivasterospora]|uniref:Cellulose binding domain-containing protein n=1 Tax=Micromonospora olivasterospora TaxID=1880 RepID=A0A562I453_MICOL|nr:cellulose binding domain-containing protein [Micromonospora olivasterospora]TWH65498.1 cellulose binding domain-containing protein [Micromonospora olivasterospora]